MTTRGSDLVCPACGRASYYRAWRDYVCPRCGVFDRGRWVREAADRAAAARLSLEEIAREYEAMEQPAMAARVRARIGEVA